MNIFLISIIVYFTISGILELSQFNDYMNGKQELWDFQVVHKQLLIWGWPIVLIGSIIFSICYEIVCLFCKVMDTFFNWE